jgi:hypothetical protein
MEIIKDAMGGGRDKNLISRGIAELSEYGDCERVPPFLVGIIDYRESPAVSNNPISQYPAAMALLRVGTPARLSLLSVAKPLTADVLQLRSVVLAKLDESYRGIDDIDEGRTLALMRVVRRIERVRNEPIKPDDENMRRISIINLRKIIEMLSDPLLLHQRIGSYRRATAEE